MRNFAPVFHAVVLQGGYTNHGCTTPMLTVSMLMRGVAPHPRVDAWYRAAPPGVLAGGKAAGTISAAALRQVTQPS